MLDVSTHTDPARGRGVVLVAAGDDVGSLSLRVVLPTRPLTRAEIEVIRAAGARVLSALLRQPSTPNTEETRCPS